MTTNSIDFYIDGEPNSVYHAKHDYIGRSELVTTYKKSYAHSLLETKKTAAMVMGSAIHDMIYAELTGDKNFFDSLYASKRKGRLKKDEKESFELENTGKTAINDKDLSIVKNVTKAIVGHPVAKKLLSGAHLERSFYLGSHMDGKAPLRARPDAYRDDGIMIDFKSAADACKEGFTREVFTRFLNIQAAHYIKAAEPILDLQFGSFIFIVAEKEAPWGVALYNLDFEILSHSKALHEKMILKYMTEKSEMRAGYPLEIQTINMPEWAKYL